jgi:hypothetical protein
MHVILVWDKSVDQNGNKRVTVRMVNRYSKMVRTSRQCGDWEPERAARNEAVGMLEDVFNGFTKFHGATQTGLQAVDIPGHDGGFICQVTFSG